MTNFDFKFIIEDYFIIVDEWIIIIIRLLIFYLIYILLTILNEINNQGIKSHTCDFITFIYFLKLLFVVIAFLEKQLLQIKVLWKIPF